MMNWKGSGRRRSLSILRFNLTISQEVQNEAMKIFQDNEFSGGDSVLEHVEHEVVVFH
jgi:hypothetical protein